MGRRLAGKVLDYCDRLALFSESEGQITRAFLCDATHLCHRHLKSWMQELGMETSVDGAGNLHGLYAGAPRSSKRLLIASHLDTVPNAGRYDGILGVVLGIALIESLGNRRLPFAIEIIGFSEEEGVRFGVPFIGSNAFIHGLDNVTLGITDRSGVRVEEAIRRFGLDPTRSAAPTVDLSAFAYLEFHIEQGPVLESMNRGLGVVEAIAGQSRASVTFQGKVESRGHYADASPPGCAGRRPRNGLQQWRQQRTLRQAWSQPSAT